jgi:hypothetical protein
MDNGFLCFAWLAIATARRVGPVRLSRHADPVYHPASLLAALPLKEHLRLTYRGVEDLLRLSDRLRRLFGLLIVPDHLTLWWFGRRHLSPDVMAAVIRETVERVVGRLRGPTLDADLGRFLAQSYDLKDAADYRPAPMITADMAEEAIRKAKHFVAQVEAALGDSRRAQVNTLS